MPSGSNSGNVNVRIAVDPQTFAAYMQGAGVQAPRQPAAPPAPGPTNAPGLQFLNVMQRQSSLSLPLLGRIALATGATALGIDVAKGLLNTVVSNSRIANTYLGAMGKVFGAAIDVLLMPFTPVLNLLLVGEVKLLQWLISHQDDINTFKNALADIIKSPALWAGVGAALLPFLSKFLFGTPGSSGGLPSPGTAGPAAIGLAESGGLFGRLAGTIRRLGNPANQFAIGQLGTQIMSGLGLVPPDSYYFHPPQEDKAENNPARWAWDRTFGDPHRPPEAGFTRQEYGDGTSRTYRTNMKPPSPLIPDLTKPVTPLPGINPNLLPNNRTSSPSVPTGPQGGLQGERPLSIVITVVGAQGQVAYNPSGAKVSINPGAATSSRSAASVYGQTG